MSRKALLKCSIAFLSVVGAIAVLTPFVASLSPNDVAKQRYMIRVSIAEIPAESYLEVDWPEERVRLFIVGANTPIIYRVPYVNGTYRLPDPSWEGPHVPCNNFVLRNNRFRCLDTGSYFDFAQWRDDGSPINDSYEPMISVPYEISGDNLIVGNDA